ARSALITKEEDQIDPESLDAPEQRVAYAGSSRVAAARAHPQVPRQFVFGQQFVERVRRELARVGQKQSFPDLPARRHPKTRRSGCADGFELEEVESEFLSHRRHRGTDDKAARECCGL